MNAATQTLRVTPRIGALLAQVTEIPDIETALSKVLTEYLDLKIAHFRQQSQQFESKWKISFEEFSNRMEAGTLDQDAYSYEVESDFWEWEQAVTLLHHYETLQSRWM